MTSTGPVKNVPRQEESASPVEDEERTIGGKATQDEIYLIDRACLELRVKRGPFIVEAAVERARIVMASAGALESGKVA